MIWRMSRAYPKSTTLLVMTLLLAAGGCSSSREANPDDTGVVRHTLANGVRVFVQPVADTDAVGIEVIYDVGFLDEPEGLTQISHLMEHLAVKSATDEYDAGVPWETLNEEGLAVAEALPTFTHFDYAVPADAFDRVLGIEADRLRSLRLDANVIATEAAACYSELEAAARSDEATLAKYACMAAHQNWRYGATGVRLGAGLEQYPVEAMARFFRSHFRPDNLMIFVAGDVDGAWALERVAHHFEGLDLPAENVARPQVNWSLLPEQSTVTWDADASGAFVWFEPPSAPEEQIVLSLWGNMISQRLTTDIELTLVSRLVMPSTYVWPVGELPFFVYATTAENYSATQVARAVSDRLDRIVEELTGADHAAHIRNYAAQLVARGEFSPSVLQSRREAMMTQLGMDSETAAARALLQFAIDAGMRDMFFRSNADQMIGALSNLTAERLEQIVRGTIVPERRHITLLVPASTGTGSM